MPRLSAQMQLNLRIQQVKAQAQRAAEIVMLDLARATAGTAQANVAPGVGPGPHPHITTHTDTGFGRSQIKYALAARSLLSQNVTAVVYTDFPGGAFDYLAAWEIGIHRKDGSLLRYQWLKPALEANISAWQARVGHVISFEMGR